MMTTMEYVCVNPKEDGADELIAELGITYEVVGNEPNNLVRVRFTGTPDSLNSLRDEYYGD